MISPDRSIRRSVRGTSIVQVDLELLTDEGHQSRRILRTKQEIATMSLIDGAIVDSRINASIPIAKLTRERSG